jgi:broad specificity phosphatase PhoE
MGSRTDLKVLQERSHPIFIYLYPEMDSDLERFHRGGSSDIGLGEDAKNELVLFSKKLKKNPFQIKTIFTGPELRTIQASDFIHDHLSVRLRILSDFGDQDLGALEGASWAEGESSWSILPAPPGGEGEEAFGLRVRAGLGKVFAEPGAALLVLHPRVAVQILLGFQLEVRPLRRGSLYCFDFSQGGWSPKFSETIQR